MVGRTTLSVPKEFREKIMEYEGDNDLQRLKKWADEYDKPRTIKTEEDAREVVKEVMREEIHPEAFN